jgi:hypothetical protein
MFDMCTVCVYTHSRWYALDTATTHRNMRHHTILGYGCNVIGRGSRDSVRRISLTIRGIHIETRKGHHFIVSLTGYTKVR